MKRLIFPILLILFVGAAMAAAAPEPDPLLHKQAPTFARNDLANRRVDLKALRGKVVLLSFWATWCAPCRIEMPRFSSWQSQFGPRGLQIIGISMDDDAAPVQSLLRQRAVNYPIVMGDEKIGGLYGGVLGLPLTYLIDRDCVVVRRFKGEANLDAMESAVRALLDAH